jgi:hypothetical protein
MFMLKRNLKQLHCGHAKRSILDQTEACREEAAIGVLLRCDGLDSSHRKTWRRQRAQAESEALAPKKRAASPRPTR